jgi:hypothetical protein
MDMPDLLHAPKAIAKVRYVNREPLEHECADFVRIAADYQPGFRESFMTAPSKKLSRGCSPLLPISIPASNCLRITSRVAVSTEAFRFASVDRLVPAKSRQHFR